MSINWLKRFYEGTLYHFLQLYSTSSPISVAPPTYHSSTDTRTQHLSLTPSQISPGTNIHDHPNPRESVDPLIQLNTSKSENTQANVARDTLPSNSIELSIASQALPETIKDPALDLHSQGAVVDTTLTTSNAHQAGHSKISFYENASNFVMYNPIMGDNIQINQVQTSNVLKEMLDYVIPGAQYDSSARDSPPRCHPGTRTQILEDVQTRIHDPDLATRMVWVYGPAGVGKSAIMQTLAEAEASRGAIFTTLFFSRPNERDDPRKALTTLAYGLAVRNSEYRRYIGERLADDPTFLAKSTGEQFQQLFVTPFLKPFTKNHINFDSQRWVVFLDGLDECRGEAEQRRIVELIRNSMLHCAVFSPFIWIIASRPEVHLKMQFTKAKADVGSFWELEVPINSEESLRDVERYLHIQFSNMHENYSDSIPPIWPSETDFLKVSEASSGLFIFASTLIAYLLGGDPVFRLKHIISLIKVARSQIANPQQNPFEMLDLLYTQIMSDVPKEILPTTEFLLGFYFLSVSHHRKGVPLLRMSNILNLGQYETYAALRKLHSVLDCPLPEEAAKRPIRFLHASFSDFLLDSSRSMTYFINSNEETTKVWQCCTKILHQFEIHRTPTCIDLSWLPRGVDSVGLQEDVWRDAQETWMLVLLNSWKETGQNKLLIDGVSLAKIVRELGPTIFRTTEGWTGLAVVDFLDWLDENAPPEVRNLRLETVPFCDLDNDKLSKSLFEQRWCYLVWKNYSASTTYHFSDIDLISTLAQFDASEWSQAKNVLWGESSALADLSQNANQRATSCVLGFEGKGRCVVVGPLIAIHPRGMTYYILPYSEEHSE